MRDQSFDPSETLRQTHYLDTVEQPFGRREIAQVDGNQGAKTRGLLALNFVAGMTWKTAYRSTFASSGAGLFCRMERGRCVMSKEEQHDDMVAEQARQGEKIANIDETCKEIKACLLGNTGLVLRTDRLEQKEKFRVKLFWLMFTALGAVAAKVLADTLGF